MRKTLLVVVGATAAIVLAAGCSGGGGGGSKNKVSGTIGGDSIDVKSAIWATLPLDSSGNLNVAVGVLTDLPDACAMLGAATIKQNTKLMLLEMGNFTGSAVTPPSVTGDYTVYGGSGTPPANLVIGSYIALDSSCNSPAMSPTIDSGTVKLTDVTGNIAGSGNGLGMSTGDTIDLSFDFQECPALAVALSTTNGGTCVP